MKIVWRKRAHDDLERQLQWIAQDRPLAAANMRERILEAIDLLPLWPLVGRAGRRGLRELPVARSPYVVIYGVDDQTVTIIRVMHGAQNR